jgi:hypothetical protein
LLLLFAAFAAGFCNFRVCCCSGAFLLLLLLHLLICFFFFTGAGADAGVDLLLLCW